MVQYRTEILTFIPVWAYAIPVIAVWGAIRHGPVRNRWWKQETPLGVALFLGGLLFLVGFVSPMILYENPQFAPLYGVFFTGPVGTLLGLLWGIERARRRRRQLA